MTEPTAERQVTVAVLGVDGVQSLLQRLNTLGVFNLANPDDVAPPGASVDLLEVTLDDGVWLVQNFELDDGDATRLDLAQALIVATVRSSPVEQVNQAPLRERTHERSREMGARRLVLDRLQS